MDSDRDARGRFIRAAHKRSHWMGIGIVVVMLAVLIILYAR